ncbi:MAG TPA: COX15/CtaA family protein [Xanthobacteraceae bacterium]|nr:COX15/CtaA family protein [Xanthobacteraceae bacterium]
MHGPRAITEEQDRMRPVRLWLYAAAALVALMVVIGGTTRLTGSGLSITEWKPVTGIVPPLSNQAWQAEFDGYKKIPQYQEINRGMSLSEFKLIYFWEWTHRALGRVIGVVFLFPLLWFAWRGLIDRALGWKLGGLFLLGGLQGAIGWWMVASGLSIRTDVSQYRLAIHLTTACFIFAAIVAVATSLEIRVREKVAPRMRYIAGAILTLVFVQIFLGAIVAKTNAGLTFNTWPLMDGNFIPPLSQLFSMSPWWKNLFENVMTVQFDHRMMAYAIFGLAAWHAWQTRGAGRSVRFHASHLFGLIVLQVALGIATLLFVAPFTLSLLHQFGAVIVLAAATRHVALLYPLSSRPSA